MHCMNLYNSWLPLRVVIKHATVTTAIIFVSVKHIFHRTQFTTLSCQIIRTCALLSVPVAILKVLCSCVHEARAFLETLTASHLFRIFAAFKPPTVRKVTVPVSSYHVGLHVQAACRWYTVKFRSGMWQHCCDPIAPDISWGIIKGQGADMRRSVVQVFSTITHFWYYTMLTGASKKKGPMKWVVLPTHVTRGGLCSNATLKYGLF
jgi:hypothetical protein